MNTKDETSKKLIKSYDENKDTYGICDEMYDAITGIVVPKYKIINTEYSNYSCSYVSDVSFSTCKNSETTIVVDYENDAKSGLLSLKTGNLILEAKYEFINEINNGNFLIKKDGKYGMVSSDGTELFTTTYDYLGYIDDTGYIAINNKDYQLYDNNLQTIDNNKLSSIYDTALNKQNEDDDEKNYILTYTANSFNIFADSYLIKYNINEKYTDTYYEINFKYKGNQFSGEKMIIFNQYNYCNKKENFFYVLDNGKIENININDLEIVEENITCY